MTTTEDTAERLDTLQTALRTAEGPLGDAGRAFGDALQGLGLAAGQGEVKTWIDNVERLGGATGRWKDAPRSTSSSSTMSWTATCKRTSASGWASSP